MDFTRDGNPIVPELALRFCKPVGKSEQEASRAQGAKPSGKSREYSAGLHVCDTPQTEYAKFVLRITNYGEREWRKKIPDWIRVGCRIFPETGSRGSPVLELREDLPKDTIGKGESFYSMFLIENESLPRGTYQVKFDMVDEHKFWFEDLGSLPAFEHVQSY